MRRSGCPARFTRATGMTLIEVLIALLLFSFCFLG
ncbi:MAG: prepilin-type N-terminal cleavage/methylation domain-containing protein, partial [Herminiimonas sp.]|nr:prepilin-type N-terminal cleavage/methylation domain-containing protein [Herminiimonas sp.]